MVKKGKEDKPVENMDEENKVEADEEGKEKDKAEQNKDKEEQDKN